MKKIICLMLCLVLIFPMLFSCNVQNDVKGNETDNPNDNDTDNIYTTLYDTSETPTNFVLIRVKDYGDIVVELYPDTAPITVENFKNLVSENFYDGLIFHRIISGFMIQGGGVTQDYKLKECPSIKGEFALNGVQNDLLHTRGVISMARAEALDSASSQFFIMHETSPHLDGKYAAFGMVLEGIETVDKIASVKTDYYNWPLEDVVIEFIRFIDYNK